MYLNFRPPFWRRVYYFLVRGGKLSSPETLLYPSISNQFFSCYGNAVNLLPIVMYRAAKYAGRDLPCAFDSGVHIVTEVKVC